MTCLFALSSKITRSDGVIKATSVRVILKEFHSFKIVSRTRRDEFNTFYGMLCSNVLSTSRYFRLRRKLEVTRLVLLSTRLIAISFHVSVTLLGVMYRELKLLFS